MSEFLKLMGMSHIGKVGDVAGKLRVEYPRAVSLPGRVCDSVWQRSAAGTIFTAAA